MGMFGQMTNDLLRDPMWQFIGAILGLIAIGVTIYLFLLQRNKKSLAYKIQTETSLLTVTDELRGKLQILYESIPVQNVSLIILKIISDGNIPIASADFEKPLNFSFGDEAKILSAEIIKTSPPNLKPKIDLQSNQIILEPILLNSQDALTIKFLISQYNTIILDARIIGVTEIKKIKEGKVSLREVAKWFIVYLVQSSVLYLLLFPEPFFSWKTVIPIMVLSVGGALAFWIASNRSSSEK